MIVALTFLSDPKFLKIKNSKVLPITNFFKETHLREKSFSNNEWATARKVRSYSEDNKENLKMEDMTF